MCPGAEPFDIKGKRLAFELWKNVQELGTPAELW